MTKLQMARVIVQALYDLPELPADNHPEVIRRASKGTVARLVWQHRIAVKALLSKVNTAR